MATCLDDSGFCSAVQTRKIDPMREAAPPWNGGTKTEMGPGTEVKATARPALMRRARAVSLRSNGADPRRERRVGPGDMAGRDAKRGRAHAVSAGPRALGVSQALSEPQRAQRATAATPKVSFQTGEPPRFEWTAGQPMAAREKGSEARTSSRHASAGPRTVRAMISAPRTGARETDTVEDATRTRTPISTGAAR